MSWFDSSFSFAKSAFSTAQKSIDRVLDIKEDGSGEANVKETDSSQHHKTDESSVTYPSPLSWQSSSSPSPQPKETPAAVTTADSDTHPDNKPSDSFSSTWGSATTFWGGSTSDTTLTKKTSKAATPPRTVTPVRTKTSHSSNRVRSSRSAGNVQSGTTRSEREVKKEDHQDGSESQEMLSQSMDSATTPAAIDTQDTRVSLPLTSTPVVSHGGDMDTAHADTRVKGEQNGSSSLPTSPITSISDHTSVVQPTKGKSSDREEGERGGRGGEGGLGGKEVSETENKDGGEKVDTVEEMLASCIAEGQSHSDTREEVDMHGFSRSDNSPPAAAVRDKEKKKGVKGNESPPYTVETQVQEENGSRVELEEADHGKLDAITPSNEDAHSPVTDCTSAAGLVGVREEPSVEAVQVKTPVEDKPDEQTNNFSVPSEDIEKVREELTRVSKVLEVRETRLVDMSKENIQLQELNQELQRQLSEAQETMKMSSSDVEEMRGEFAKRLSSAEKKLQVVIKERDSLKKQLQAVEEEYSQQKKTSEHELKELLKEKEEQVAGLMEEGEQLSKQQLASNNIIKKLRVKEKQADQLATSLRQQIDSLETEVKKLKEVVKKREETERKYQESLSQLNTIAEQQSKDLSSIKPERDELLEKVRSLKSNLDGAYKELAELRKANALTQSAAQEAALSAEMSAKEELRDLLSQQQLQAQKDKETLVLQVNDLRMSVQRTEQQNMWREEQLRQEIAELQQRLQDSESRNQDLSTTISDATKPLLRQIENLQSAHSAQVSNWEKVETNLTQRLVDAQTQLSVAVEAERNAVEREMMLQGRVNLLESQMNSLRQERSQLTAALEMERTKLQTIEDGHQREVARLETVRSHLTQNLDGIRKEKELLERQLEYERVRLEAESRKATLEYQEKERLRNQLALSISRPPPTPHTRTSSTSSSQGYGDLSMLDRSVSHEGSVSADTDSLTYNRAPVGSAMVIDRLQSLLKQKEGELANAQNLVVTLERSRSTMAEELAKLASANEDLKVQAESVAPLKHRLLEVQQKYEAMLQMYGEKAEQVEELRLDIQDLKTLYRQQIEDLLAQR